MDIVFFAGFEFNDIEDKLILDLGAGTGRLSITCSYLGASKIISVDLDYEALIILNNNSKTLNLQRKINPICCDLANPPFRFESLKKRFNITTLMNPPFGVQKKYADRIFLKSAFKISNIIYSIHLANKEVHEFLTKYSKKFGWTIDYFFPYSMVLEKSYIFHTKKRKEIDIYVYRFVKNKK